jgi:hypothetical protein
MVRPARINVPDALSIKHAAMRRGHHRPNEVTTRIGNRHHAHSYLSPRTIIVRVDVVEGLTWWIIFNLCAVVLICEWIEATGVPWRSAAIAV